MELVPYVHVRDTQTLGEYMYADLPHAIVDADWWDVETTTNPDIGVITFDGVPISQMADTEFYEQCDRLVRNGGLVEQTQLKLLKACWSEELQNYDMTKLKDLIVFLVVVKSINIIAIRDEITEILELDNDDFAYAAAMVAAGDVTVESILAMAAEAAVDKEVVAA